MYRTYKILIVTRNMGKTEAAGRRFMDSYYIWKISVIIFAVHNGLARSKIKSQRIIKVDTAKPPAGARRRSGAESAALSERTSQIRPHRAPESPRLRC